MSKTTPTKGNLILKGLIGTVDKVIRLANGNLIVGLQREGQAQNLMGIESFGLSPCKVSEFTKMNTKKGVIRAPAFRGISEEEIAEDLASEGVVGVKKLFFTKDGQKFESSTVILTFDGSVLPGNIKAGYMSIKVDPYIPNPLRCFQCNRFGHPKDRCKRTACCARCGSSDHTDDRECRERPHCVNCDGEHSSFSKECPKWKIEKEIQRLKITQNISFQQARQQISPTTAPGQLYSSIVQKKVQTTTIATQVTAETFGQVDPGDKFLSPSVPKPTAHAQAVTVESEDEIISPSQPKVSTKSKDLTSNYRSNKVQQPAPASAKPQRQQEKEKRKRKPHKNLQGKQGEDACGEAEESMDFSADSSPPRDRQERQRSPVRPPT